MTNVAFNREKKLSDTIGTSDLKVSQSQNFEHVTQIKAFKLNSP